MNSSKTIFLFAVVALIMLFVFPIQSINEHSEKLPMRHKRWTFNTWRLHGRRQLSNDFYSSKLFPVDQDHPYEIFDNENDMARERLSELFEKYIHH